MTSRPDSVLGLPSLDAKGGEGAALPLGRSLSVLILASFEAVCVFYVAVAKIGIVVAAAAAGTSSWVTFWRHNLFRIPILVVAIVGSVLNLFLLVRSRRLRTERAA